MYNLAITQCVWISVFDYKDSQLGLCLDTDDIPEYVMCFGPHGWLSAVYRTVENIRCDGDLHTQRQVDARWLATQHWCGQLELTEY